MNPTKKESQFKYRIDEIVKILAERFAIGDTEINLNSFINIHCYRFLVSKRTMKEIIEIAATRVPAKIEGGKILKNGIQQKISH